MEFTVNTKPLIDALSLGIVNANVSKFFSKSCMAQVKADKHHLTINLEASRIETELTLKGAGNSDETAIIFVDCLLLKQLVSTFESGTTVLEFTDSGLVLHSGKSKFTLPKMLDADDFEFKAVDSLEGSGNIVKINKSNWKFVKDNQMYAIAMSFIHPIYTLVWTGSSGDVIVGDFDNSVFTHSKQGDLKETCLLTDTIINLFNALPDGSELLMSGKDYIVRAVTDTYQYRSKFKPQYEDDDDLGSYNSDMILNMMSKPNSGFSKVKSSIINKFLSQAAILSTSAEATMKFGVQKDEIFLEDSNVDCKIPFTCVGEVPEYEITFKADLLKSVISHYGDDEISVAPLTVDDEITGIILWNDKLTTVLAGVE